MILLPKGIKNADKLSAQDLREVAWFNNIVLNYIK